jgi:hypothetical protein
MALGKIEIELPEMILNGGAAVAAIADPPEESLHSRSYDLQ